MYLAFANFFFFLSNSFFHLLPIYLDDLNASKSYIGIIMGLTPAVLVCFTWILRNKIDFINQRKSLLVSSLLAVTIFMLYFAFSNIYTIPIFRFLQGIIFSVGFTFGTALAIKKMPESKKTGLLGLFGISGALTNAVGPFIGEKIIGSFGYSYVFIASAISALIWFFCLLLVKDKDKFSSKKDRAEVSLFKKVIPIAVLFGLVFSGIFSFISHYAKEEEVLPVSYFYVTYSSTIVLVRAFFYKHLNSWNRERLIMGSFILCFLALFAAMFLENFSYFYILIIVGNFYGIAHGFLYPSVNMLFVDHSPKRSGKATLIFILFFNLGYTSASFILGFVADYLSYSKMYGITSLVILVGSISLFKKKLFRVSKV